MNYLGHQVQSPTATGNAENQHPANVLILWPQMKFSENSMKDPYSLLFIGKTPNLPQTCGVNTKISNV